MKSITKNPEILYAANSIYEFMKLHSSEETKTEINMLENTTDLEKEFERMDK